MGATASCCVSRGTEELQPAQGPPQREEFLQFFDCIEPEECAEEPSPGPQPGLRPRLLAAWERRRARLRSLQARLRGALGRSLRRLPEEPAMRRLECAECLKRQGSQDFTEANVANVARSVRELWEDRLEADGLDGALAEKLHTGFPELEEWTSDEVVRRMLRAAGGHEREAVQLLAKAVECRVRDRELFASMRCEPTCDMRVIGYDVEQRPTIYVCARSQRTPLKDLRPQIFLAFEAAARLTSPDGQVVLLADMTGFSAGLNMDPFVLRELAECFGSVFADRVGSVLIIDFSVLAQAMWSTCQALLSDRTRRKINFLGERQLRSIAKERFDAASCERILSAVDINRRRSSTAKERAVHAQRTSVTATPLGEPEADKAG